MKSSFAFLLLLLKVSPGFTQVKSGPERNALFLYTFAKYINWNVFVDQKAIIIGVSGNEEVYRQLKENFNDRKVGERRIRVIRVTGIDAADCQILYISNLQCTSSQALLDYIRHLQVLVVTDCPAENPEVDIAILSNSLSPHDYYLKINRQNIRLKGLKISMELMGLSNVLTFHSPRFFGNTSPLEYFSKPETFTL